MNSSVLFSRLWVAHFASFPAALHEHKISQIQHNLRGKKWADKTEARGH